MLYCAADLVLPFYNKLLYAGFGSANGFHFPIFSSAVQVGLVAIMGFVWLAAKQLVQQKQCQEFTRDGPFSNIGWKCKQIVPVALTFALLIVLSNMGLDKINLNVHILLRTTSVVWIVIFSLLLREWPSLSQLACAAAICTGAVLLSIDVSFGWVCLLRYVLITKKIESHNTIGVVLTLVSSFCSGIHTILLRNLCKKTEGPPHSMGIIEVFVLFV